MQQRPLQGSAHQVLLRDAGGHLLTVEQVELASFGIAAVTVLLSADVVARVSGMAQVLLHQVAEGEVPAVRLHQVAGDQGVLHCSAQRQASPGEAFAGILIVMDQFWGLRLGQPLGEVRLQVGVGIGQSDRHRSDRVLLVTRFVITARWGEDDGERFGTAGGVVALGFGGQRFVGPVQAQRHTDRRLVVGGEEIGELMRLIDQLHGGKRLSGLCCQVRIGEACGEGFEQPVADLVELQGVEQRLHTLAIGHGEHAVFDSCRQVEVSDQPVEFEVAFHVSQGSPQVLPHFASDLVGVFNDSADGSVLPDPFRRGLRPDLRDPRQVIGGLSHQCCKITVPLRGDQIFRLHSGRVEPDRLGDAGGGVVQVGVLADQLQGVTVAGDDQRLPARRRGAGGISSHNVICFVALPGHCGNVHCGSDLLDEVDLAGELRRGLVSSALVLLVGLVPECGGVQIEGQHNMGRLLLADELEQHIGEAVHCVGVLAGGRLEALHRQRVERAECHGVAVDHQQLIALSSHADTISSSAGCSWISCGP